jgi:hypothetical protein
MHVPSRDCLLAHCPILLNICMIGRSRGTSMVKRRSKDIQQLPLTQISFSLLFHSVFVSFQKVSIPLLLHDSESQDVQNHNRSNVTFSSLYQCFSEISTSFTSTPSLNQRSESASLTSFPLICLFLIRPSSAYVQSSRP